MKKIVPNDAVLVPDEADCVFEGEIFDVYQWQQSLFDGSTARFEMLKRPDTTSVLCIVDGKLIVLDEEQPNSGKRRSFPGGRVDPPDPDIIAAAKREVLEETGYTFENWRLINVWQPIKKMEWFVHYVLAWEPTGQQATKHDPGEKITVELLDLDEVKQLAKDRKGFLHEMEDVLESVTDISELATLPEFQGRAIERS